jgi:mevalonate kinase
MTEPLVTYFKDQLKQYAFFRRLTNELIPSTNLAISALLDEDQVKFYENLRAISSFQIKHLAPMIPDTMRPVWQAGLDTDLYTMKLCGSGGGGFLLGFSNDLAATEAYMHKHFPRLNWIVQ